VVRVDDGAGYVEEIPYRLVGPEDGFTMRRGVHVISGEGAQ
jgi:hypothetical protein